MAYSAREALACAADFKPDVCLLDVGLPEMDGYGQAEDRQRALAAGFDDHLVKPVDLCALEHSLAEIAGSGSRDELSMTTS